jgi:hypothetical protein
MKHCRRCKSPISAWETHRALYWDVKPCWCSGLPKEVPPTLGNLAYVALCDPELSQPVKSHDVARFVTDFGYGNPGNSLSVALSQDKRFCWAGRGLYGLARHRLIPGVRTLAEAAYVALLAAPRSLYAEEVDFILEQLNFRFNRDSLIHHLRGYTANRWDLKFKTRDRRLYVSAGRDARHEFNRMIQVCPQHNEFDSLIDKVLKPQVNQALTERTSRLTVIGGGPIEIPGDRIEFG